MEGDGANDGAGVVSVDRHVWLGAKQTSAIRFDGVEDGGFVGTEDVNLPVQHARMVVVEEASGRG